MSKEIEDILSRLSNRDEEGFKDAAALRAHIHRLSDDPVLSMLSVANNRIVESIDRLSHDLPKAFTQLGRELRTEVRSNNRTTLTVVAICLVLMSGLVGTSVILDRTGVLSVNQQRETTGE